MSSFTRICDLIDRMLSVLLGVICLVLIGALFVQVVNRYVLGIGWAFNSFLIRNLFIWVIAIGIVLATRKWAHFRMDFFDNSRIGVVRLIVLLIAAISVVLGGIIIAWTSANLIPLSLRKTDPSTGWTDIAFYLSLPAAGGLMTLFAIEQLVHVIRHRSRPAVLSDDLQP